jgi:hypothetical protein
LRGTAKISADWQPIGKRVWRYLVRTFNFAVRCGRGHGGPLGRLRRRCAHSLSQVAGASKVRARFLILPGRARRPVEIRPNTPLPQVERVRSRRARRWLDQAEGKRRSIIARSAQSSGTAAARGRRSGS